MSFHNLSQFNIALLAKQRWCLINDQSSLLARSLKANYFLNTDLLRVGLGAYHLFT